MLIYISDRTKEASAICNRLFDGGILLFSCPYETALFLCEKKDTGGVVIDCVPDLNAGERLCAELRRRYPPMPIAAIVSPACIPNLECDVLIRDTSDADGIAERIEQFYVHLCGWTANNLTTYALAVDFESKSVLYRGYPLSLTPAQFRILHCLFYRTPRPTSPDDLLSLCYLGKIRSIGNIGVQIHKINQKAARIDPRPLIIHEKEGYRLRDGIV